MDDNVALSVLLFKYKNADLLNTTVEILRVQETDFEYEILVDTSFLPKEERFGEEEYLSTLDKVRISNDPALDSASELHYRLTNCLCDDDTKVLQKYMDIVRRDAADPREIMVSISMTTYNQEKYIARAIESLLMQEVDFRYEVIIGEDCSTDSTRAIVERYHRKYPDILKPIYHAHNVGLRENDNCIRRRLRGKYRAILEGDDFWIARDRLKRHVEFLEHNPEFIAIAGEFITVNSKGQIRDRPNPQIYSHTEIFDLSELEKWKMPCNTLALTHRNIFRSLSEEELNEYIEINIIGDRKLYLFLLMQGSIYHSPYVVAARTFLPASSHSWTGIQNNINVFPLTHTWYENAERYALSYQKKIDLSDKKYENWIMCCKRFAKFPTKRNFAAMRVVYHKMPDKKLCRRKLREKTIKYLKKQYMNKSFLAGTFTIIGKGFKFVGKAFKNLFKKNQQAADNQKIKRLI